MAKKSHHGQPGKMRFVTEYKPNKKVVKGRNNRSAQKAALKYYLG